MLRLPSTRHPFTTLAVAGAIVLAGCSEKSLVGPQKTVAVNRSASGVFVTSLGDLTWIDSNGNGIQDAGDLPLGGVTINLYEGAVCGGAPIQTTQTDAISGGYLFYVQPGTYSVEAETPANYTPTAANVGADRELDSNPACSTVTLADGQYDNSFDYGYVSAIKPYQGCTPGYWKNHTKWPAPYTQSTLFSAVFADAFPGKTFQQVLSQGGGGINALGRQTVSAYLNSLSIGTPKFAYSSSTVVTMFNAAFAAKVYDPTKNAFESKTDSYAGFTCPLN